MGAHLNWLAKIKLKGPKPPLINIIVNYFCTRVLLYAKMLKETIVFFVTFLSLVAFQLGGSGPLPPLATPMVGIGKSSTSLSFFGCN